MSVEENKAIARRWLEEGVTNPDMLGEIFAAESTFNGQVYSLERAKQRSAAWLAAFPDVHYVVDDVFGDGDKVAIRYTGSGTHKGEWGGLKPTNNTVTPTGIYILRFADGKIVEGWNYSNDSECMRQWGLIPSWKELVEKANAKRE